MRRALPWLLLSLCLLGSLFLVIYPLTIIQPFLRQFPEPLQRALFVFRIAPVVSTVLCVVAIVTALASWRHLRFGGRIGAVVLLILTCGVAVAARVNVFELMFHPAGMPALLTVNQAKLDPDDVVMTVTLNGESHAYPVREIAYHHVINDTAGGVPIVATY